jgi:hypothetical protein
VDEDETSVASAAGRVTSEMNIVLICSEKTVKCTHA